MRDIHPHLRTDALMNRMLGTPFMGLGALGIFTAVVVGAMRGDAPVLLLVLGCGIGALFAWAAWYCWDVRWYRRATWVFTEVVAKDAHAEFRYGEPDSVHLTEISSDGTPAAEWYMPCSLPVAAKSLKDGIVVAAHIDPLPGGPIIIETPAGIIWPLARTPSKRLVTKNVPRESRRTAPGQTTGIAGTDENAFGELEARLRDDGCADQAERLAILSRDTAWTSSSEFLGEYGLALKSVRKACWRRLSPETWRAYAAAVRAVRGAWPGLRI